ncbi:hypothetical protein RB2150_03124 [Rhodobacterales bacterium HTCC2150]|nr:hypothetical protein RB2150_03124 [Rhodobacterales bacterium HTCC2150] [Rhodobacteraceae bacterium HTCC2150]
MWRFFFVAQKTDRQQIKSKAKSQA